MSNSYTEDQKNYFIRTNGSEHGPYVEEQLREMLSAGQIDANTPIWTEGLTAWLPFSSVLPAVPEPPAPRPMAAPEPQAGEPSLPPPTPPSEQQQMEPPHAQTRSSAPADPMRQILFWLKVGCGLCAATLLVQAFGVFASLNPGFTSTAKSNKKKAADVVVSPAPAKADKTAEVVEKSPAPTKNANEAEKNPDKAEKEYQKGLVELYGAGKGHVDDAFKCFGDAAGAGHMKAQYMCAECCPLYKSNIRTYKAELYQKAAEQGHVNAMMRMINLCLNGEGVHQSKKEAAKWARALYKKGYLGLVDNESFRKEIALLGPISKISPDLWEKIYDVHSSDWNENNWKDLNIFSEPLDEEEIKTIKTIKTLAKNGDIWAQYFDIYHTHMDKSKDEMCGPMEKLAQKGFIEAQLWCARYYYDEGDYQTAQKWCAMADDSGCESAQKLLWEIRIKMDETIE